MPIPEQFIDELVARSEISDVVSSYVHLTRKGNNLWGLCPFHNEKTPSFSVSPDKQIYHCFGCGKGGGVISFIMEIENLPFPDAVRLLAQRAGLEVPDTGADDAGRKKRARALAANRDAARFYHDYLKGPGGARVRDYLAQRQVAPLRPGGGSGAVGRADQGADRQGIQQDGAHRRRAGRGGQERRRVRQVSRPSHAPRHRRAGGGGRLHQPHPAGGGGGQVPQHPGDYCLQEGAADLRPQLCQEHQAAQSGAGGGQHRRHHPPPGGV